MVKQGTKVYKRAGIIHVCWKGSHYAPKGDVTNIELDLADLCDDSGELFVKQGVITETWYQRVIGDDAKKAPKATKKNVVKAAKVTKPKNSEKNSEGGEKAKKSIVWTVTPSEQEALDMIREVAPTSVYPMLAQTWSNWYRITMKGNRNHVLFSRVEYSDEEVEAKIRAVGAKLTSMFKDVFPPEGACPNPA
jgi:hypothetical protein